MSLFAASDALCWMEPEAAPSSSRHAITEVLLEWNDGDAGALDHLVPLVYDDLRRIAGSFFRRERVGHTLQATAVVSELYFRLVNQRRLNWRNRGQFFAAAATLIRRILVSHARKTRAAKRGAGVLDLSLDEAMSVAAENSPGVIALDDALVALAEFAPRQSKIVELRYFAGLTIDETAEALGISATAVKLDWSLAKAWLYRELSRD